jgi:putative Mn2+ efflux pump MntP
MLQIILLGVLAGADNLQVAGAISMAPLTRSRRLLFAIAFSVCEIATPLLGLLIMHSIQERFGVFWIDRIAPLIVVLCGVVILGFAITGRDELQKLVNRQWTLAVLPLFLSLDNLMIGVSLGAFGYPLLFAAATIGTVSACMCVIGIAGGARIRRWFPAHANVMSGLYLIVLAAFMWS